MNGDKGNSLTFWFISKLNLEINFDFFRERFLSQTIRTIQESRQERLYVSIWHSRSLVGISMLSMF